MTIKNTIYTYTTTPTAIINLEYAPLTCVINLNFTSANKTVTNYYLKVTTNTTNYSITSPASGQFGIITPQTTMSFSLDISRANPTVATTESLALLFSYYTDAGYSTLVGSDTLTYTVYFEDYSTGWTRTIYSFNSDMNGFTTSGGFSWVNTPDIDNSGGCIQAVVSAANSSNTATVSTTKTLNLPVANTIRMSFHVSFKAHAYNFGSISPQASAICNYIDVAVNGNNTINATNLYNLVSSGFGGGGFTVYGGWYCITADLSNYQNIPSATISILSNLTAYASYLFGGVIGYMDFFINIDRITIAYK